LHAATVAAARTPILIGMPNFESIRPVCMYSCVGLDARRKPEMHVGRFPGVRAIRSTSSISLMLSIVMVPMPAAIASEISLSDLLLPCSVILLGRILR
jgi:hypothetical protein